MNFIIFGDSIAWGAWDREGGWAARLKKFLDEKIISSNFTVYHPVYNLAIDGDNTQELLPRFEQELAARINPQSPTTVIIAIGINDSQIELSTNTNKTSPDMFAHNLRSLVYDTKKYDAKVVFVGLTPVDEKAVYPIPWKQTHGYTNAEIKKFDNIIKKLSEENNAGYIGLINTFPEKFEDLLIDGLHPNDEGHKHIFENIKKNLLGNSIFFGRH